MIFKYLIILVLILLLVLFTVISVIYYGSKPIYTGTTIINRNFDKITIYRDEYGVPHIDASTPEAAFYGMGYAHAQDRLFQLHLNRMISQGRLSEMLGNATLSTDIFLRTVGLARAGNEQAKHISPILKPSLEAYRDGINDYVATLKMLPLDFQILRISFQNWTLSDSFSFMMLLSLKLSSDFQIEGIRSKLEEVYGRDMAELMFLNRGEALFEETVIINDEELKQMGLFEQFNRSKYTQNKDKQNQEQDKAKQATKFALIQKYSLPEYLHILYNGLGGASNGWAISGKHTNTGKPIVANDPHLDIKMPTMWYLVEQIFKNPFSKSSEDWIVSGASMPGTPFLFSGRTNFAAYGVTAMLADSIDLIAEEIDYTKNVYYHKGVYLPLTFIEERILVRGQPDHIKRVPFTHRGPVFDPEQVPFYDGKRPVSFLWTSLVSNCTNLEGIYHLSLATQLSDFTNHLPLVTSPTLSCVFGTVDGHIGYYGTGRIPIRQDPTQIGFILNANSSSADWIGLVPPEAQPHLIDPAKGYVAVANNKFATDNIRFQQSLNVPSTSRALRIKQMIESFIQKGQKISVKDVQAMQSDVLDPYAQLHMPAWISLFESQAQHFISGFKESVNDNNSDYQSIQILRKMFQIIKEWDFQMKVDSIGATIFKLWEHYLFDSFFQELYPDRQTRLSVTVSKQGFFFDHFFFKEISRWSKGSGDLNSKWCLNEQSRKFGQNKACVYNFVHAFELARDYLVNRLGSNVETWRYGLIHKYWYQQTPFSETPLKYLYERSHESGGSRRTVQDAFSMEYKGNFDAYEGANLKIISSLDDEDESFQIIDSGQSESLFSSHYDDLQSVYKKGEYIRMRRGRKHFNEYKEKLVLQDDRANYRQQQQQQQDINKNKQNNEL